MWIGKDFTISEQRAYLEVLGFKIGERDNNINTRYPGIYMVAESYEPDELPTLDGSNGPWCLVGDYLDDLITRAFNVWYDEAQEADNLSRALHVANLAAGCE